MSEDAAFGTVALPETRQLDVLAQLLERRGADVLRCPLVAILDTPHQAGVEAWLRRLIETPPDLVIFYTGEGIYRLSAAAERAGLAGAFAAALGATKILTRGPKPVRALKTLAIEPTYAAAEPTTAGIITTLETLDLTGQRVAVQYYGAEANASLAEYLERRDVTVDPVMPYVYASEADDRAVEDLIDRLADGRVEAIAFTSKAQVERLFNVARQAGREGVLAEALSHRIVAAVGPVVAAQLHDHGCSVDVMPEGTWFMKPLVRSLLERLAQN